MQCDGGHCLWHKNASNDPERKALLKDRFEKDRCLRRAELRRDMTRHGGQHCIYGSLRPNSRRVARGSRAEQGPPRRFCPLLPLPCCRHLAARKMAQERNGAAAGPGRQGPDRQGLPARPWTANRGNSVETAPHRLGSGHAAAHARHTTRRTRRRHRRLYFRRAKRRKQPGFGARCAPHTAAPWRRSGVDRCCGRGVAPWSRLGRGSTAAGPCSAAPRWHSQPQAHLWGR